MASRTKSFIWNNFTKISSDRAKCDICATILSVRGGSTTNLIRHVKTKHPGVDLVNLKKRVSFATLRKINKNIKIVFINFEKIPRLGVSSGEDENGDGAQSRTDQVETVSKTQPSLDEPSTSTATANKRDHQLLTQKINSARPAQFKMTHFTNRSMSLNKSKEIDQQLVCLVASDYLPFALVENEEFKKFVKMLNPSYVIPSRKTVSQVLLTQVYNKLSEIVKEDLKQATAISITTDGWTSVSNDCYLALTIHYINDNCELRSYLLDCFKYNERHTARKI